MNTNYLNLYLVLFTLALLVCFSCETKEVEAETSTTSFVYDETIQLPEGFKAIPVIDSIGFGRHLVVNTNGDIYVQLRRPKDGFSTAALRDTNNDARADIIEYFGSHPGTGIAIRNNYLYCSSDMEVFRYPLENGKLVPDTTKKEQIAGGFIDQRSHRAKSLTLDSAGHLYVNVGAPSNACMEEARTKGSPGLSPCPQLARQAGIWKFDANQNGQDQQEDGARYAMGIRNAVAVEWNPITNSLFALQHGRDQLHAFFPDMYDTGRSAELPSEEFFELNEGDDLGWPYCYNDHGIGKKVLAPEYGGDGETQGRCADAKAPLVAFPGHMAPNDLIFYDNTQFPEKYRNGAFIAFHGSWNRAPLRQKGYFIAFVPMNGNQAAGEWEIFADGFSGLDSDKGEREVVYRPTGVAVGPDGGLFVADSQKGKVWKIVFEETPNDEALSQL